MLHNSFNLDSIASSTSNHDPIFSDKYEDSVLRTFLERMVLIREVESKLAFHKRLAEIGGPVHLAAGQEAVAVGISYSLTKTDKVFGAHRSHPHLLALDSDPFKLFCEILGKESGLSKGMGGSMHLWDEPNGFYGSVPIVAGTVSLALGAAMAARLRKTSEVSVAYFGDGACEEGVVHECLNLASLQKDPIIFVVENNLFASHMNINLRQPKNSTSRFAYANDIPYSVVDGNNVLEVADAAKKLIISARESKGPGFIEAVTYRYYGHVDWREDIDVGVNRSSKDLYNWKRKDPILRLKNGMISNNIISEEDYQNIIENIKDKIKNAWENALLESYPEPDSLLSRVYKS